MRIHSPTKPLEYAVNGQRSFVVIGRDIAPDLRAYLEELRPHRIAVITDETVNRLHGESMRALLAKLSWSPGLRWVTVPPGEKSKTLSTAGRVLEELLPHMTRDSLILAFGGGVVGNLAGTVASLLFRGTRFVHVPTTFMAQADSAIGIKQAVNADHAKNAFGAYHAPLAVFNDVRYLDTLPIEQWRNGVAESIKVAVAREPAFADELETLLPRVGALTDDDVFHLLERTIYPKLSGLAGDPHERNALLYLEIGHTIGHAIERASDGAVPHGQAIAMGMLIETRIGILLGLSTDTVYRRLERLFDLAELPTELPASVSVERVMHSLKRDNRRVASGPLFVFADAIGSTRTESGIDMRVVRAVLEASRSRVIA